MSWVDEQISKLSSRIYWQESKHETPTEYDVEKLKLLEALKGAREALLKCRFQANLMKTWGAMSWDCVDNIAEVSHSSIEKIDELGK